MKPPPSSTLRYWNLARERPCRPSASYRRATPVSPDRTARSAPHTGGKSPAFRRERAKSRETQTLRWREVDSNHRSLGKENCIAAPFRAILNPDRPQVSQQTLPKSCEDPGKRRNSAQKADQMGNV